MYGSTRQIPGWPGTKGHEGIALRFGRFLWFDCSGDHTSGYISQNVLNHTFKTCVLPYAHCTFKKCRKFVHPANIIEGLVFVSRYVQHLGPRGKHVLLSREPTSQ